MILRITEYLVEKHGCKLSHDLGADDQMQSQQHQHENGFYEARPSYKHSKRGLLIPGMITSTSRLEIANDVWGLSLLKEILLWSCQHGMSPVSTRSQEESYQPSTSEGNVYIHKQYSF